MNRSKESRQRWERLWRENPPEDMDRYFSPYFRGLSLREAAG